jgi:hypothetical protein
MDGSCSASQEIVFGTSSKIAVKTIKIVIKVVSAAKLTKIVIWLNQGGLVFFYALVVCASSTMLFSRDNSLDNAN